MYTLDRESTILNLRILESTGYELVERAQYIIVIFVSPNAEVYVCLVIWTEFDDLTVIILMLAYFFQFPFHRSIHLNTCGQVLFLYMYV